MSKSCYQMRKLRNKESFVNVELFEQVRQWESHNIPPSLWPKFSLKICSQRRYDMNGTFQMQGGESLILPKLINATGFSETLIGLKSGKITYVPLWDRMEGAWLWTQKNSTRIQFAYGLCKHINKCILYLCRYEARWVTITKVYNI
jgi:hypothetical protein